MYLFNLCNELEQRENMWKSKMYERTNEGKTMNENTREKKQKKKRESVQLGDS